MKNRNIISELARPGKVCRQMHHKGNFAFVEAEKMSPCSTEEDKQVGFYSAHGQHGDNLGKQPRSLAGFRARELSPSVKHKEHFLWDGGREITNSEAKVQP